MHNLKIPFSAQYDMAEKYELARKHFRRRLSLIKSLIFVLQLSKHTMSTFTQPITRHLALSSPLRTLSTPHTRHTYWVSPVDTLPLSPRPQLPPATT